MPHAAATRSPGEDRSANDAAPTSGDSEAPSDRDGGETGDGNSAGDIDDGDGPPSDEGTPTSRRRRCRAARTVVTAEGSSGVGVYNLGALEVYDSEVHAKGMGGIAIAIEANGTSLRVENVLLTASAVGSAAMDVAVEGTCAADVLSSNLVATGVGGRGLNVQSSGVVRVMNDVIIVTGSSAGVRASWARTPRPTSLSAITISMSAGQASHAWCTRMATAVTH